MRAAKRLYEFQTTGGIFVQQGPCLLEGLHRKAARCPHRLRSEGMKSWKPFTPASPACQVELCLGDKNIQKSRSYTQLPTSAHICSHFQNNSRNLRPKMSKVLHDAQALPHLVNFADDSDRQWPKNIPNFLEVSLPHPCPTDRSCLCPSVQKWRGSSLAAFLPSQVIQNKHVTPYHNCGS